MTRQDRSIQALKAWGPAAIWAAVLFLLSRISGEGTPDWPWMSDKVVHLGLYAVLGLTLAWAGRESGWNRPFLLLALGFGYGVLDEWHQSFVPGRDPSFGDLLADGVGVALGVLLGGLLLARTRS